MTDALAEVVVPIALAVKRQQFAHELWHYKYDADERVRRRLETRLAAVLWRFLEQYETHVAVLASRYRATQAMTGHPAVLLVDDTWTTGARARSAAIALHDAGAARVAVVVLGRHFDRDFGSGETYYQQAKTQKFTWDTCCLEIDPPTDMTPA